MLISKSRTCVPLVFARRWFEKMSRMFFWLLILCDGFGMGLFELILLADCLRKQAGRRMALA